MSIDDRRLFLELVEQGSYVATARKTGIARTTVMRHVERLEQELGVALVHRAGRALAVTQAGHRLAEGLRGLFAGLERVEQSVRAVAGNAAGTVRIWLPTLGTTSGVVDCFATFILEHPNIDLRIDIGRDARKAKPGDYDALLQMSHRANPDLHSLTLFRDRLLLVASPAYLRAHGEPTTLEALREHISIDQRDSTGRVLPWRLPDGTRVERPTARVSTEAIAYVYAFALRGVGIARVSESLAVNALQSGRLCQILPEVTVEEPVSMVYLPDPSAATRTLLAFMKAYWASGDRSRT